MIRVLAIHGPNLNLPGKREEAHYGDMTQEEINNDLAGFGQEWDLSMEHIQFYHGGEIVKGIRKASSGKNRAIIINPAASLQQGRH